MIAPIQPRASAVTGAKLSTCWALTTPVTCGPRRTPSSRYSAPETISRRCPSHSNATCAARYEATTRRTRLSAMLMRGRSARFEPASHVVAASSRWSHGVREHPLVRFQHARTAEQADERGRIAGRIDDGKHVETAGIHQAQGVA